MATLLFLLLDLRASLFKFRGFRISQACPSFPILLPIDAIPQEFGITGITLPLVRIDLVAAAGVSLFSYGGGGGSRTRHQY